MIDIALNDIGQLYVKLGERTIRQTVDRFYDLMDTEPQFKRLREIHPADSTESRNKLFSFLVGRLGGPPLYQVKYGSPMLRARHAPFPIGPVERDQWMACMTMAVSETISSPDITALLLGFLDKVADAMQNRAES